MKKKIWPTGEGQFSNRLSGTKSEPRPGEWKKGVREIGKCRDGGDSAGGGEVGQLRAIEGRGNSGDLKNPEPLQRQAALERASTREEYANHVVGSEGSWERLDLGVQLILWVPNSQDQKFCFWTYGYHYAQQSCHALWDRLLRAPHTQFEQLYSLRTQSPSAELVETPKTSKKRTKSLQPRLASPVLS